MSRHMYALRACFLDSSWFPCLLLACLFASSAAAHDSRHARSRRSGQRCQGLLLPLLLLLLVLVLLE